MEVQNTSSPHTQELPFITNHTTVWAEKSKVHHNSQLLLSLNVQRKLLTGHSASQRLHGNSVCCWGKFLIERIPWRKGFLIVYLAHQIHQQSHSPAIHRKHGWLADTFHLHTEIPQVGIGAQGWQVHRTPHLIGQHSLGGHHNAEPGSNMVHCRVGVHLLNSLQWFCGKERLILST